MDIEGFLTHLIASTKTGKTKWSRTGNDDFRTDLKSGSVELGGNQEPTSLRREFDKSTLMTVGDGVTTLVQFILGPVLKMVVPEGQRRVEWPIRKVTIRDTQGNVVCRAEIDRESGAYMEASVLLFQARTQSEAAAASSVLDAMVTEMNAEDQKTEQNVGPKPPPVVS